MLKSGYIRVNPQETRIIDSNARAESRLREIAAELARQCGEEPDDGFREGLSAEEISDLTRDEDGNITGYGDASAQAAQEEKKKDASQIYEETIAKAKEEVEKLKRDAVAEIEAQRKNAAEEGRKQGYDEGYAQGKKQGYDEGHKDGLDSVAHDKELAALDAERKMASLEARYQSKFDELEPKFIETLTGIYEHIFHVSLKNSRELIVYLIQNTMRNVEGGTTYLIHVSKEDFPFVSMQKRELIKNTNINIDLVELLEDATLGKNECMIETGNGIFDCSLGTQLEALNQELRLLSYEP